MSNIKVFDNDLPDDLNLSIEKFLGLDNEALGLVLGRTRHLVQLGLESKILFRQVNRDTYKTNLVRVLSSENTQFIMHYARQDLMWLKYHLNVKPKNIFCVSSI